MAQPPHNTLKGIIPTTLKSYHKKYVSKGTDPWSLILFNKPNGRLTIQWPADKVALKHVASTPFQIISLLLVFHSLCNNIVSQLVPHGNDIPCDCPFRFKKHKPVYKGLVYLKAAYAKLPLPCKGGISCTEIVNCNLYSSIP